MQGYLEATVFSKEYRSMVADLKKLIRQDLKDEERIDDIRAGEGAGRKGSADVSSSLSKSGYTRRSSRKKSGSADNETKNDSDSGAASPTDGQI